MSMPCDFAQFPEALSRAKNRTCEYMSSRKRVEIPAELHDQISLSRSLRGNSSALRDVKSKYTVDIEYAHCRPLLRLTEG